ncbi:MAG: hydrogenase maturation nickel metallochaperone HypA [Dehalococcoidia bacterium]|nr:hydrogenase maturation nickel metallochaperone HypA [Dehalococcoidia bacterium]
MHELAITQSMLDLVLEQAGKAEAKEVGKINLVIGEMTGVVGECVQFYFDFISKGTLAEGAELSFTVVPTTARCRGCDKSFELKEFDWTCPYCQGNNMEIVAGKELFVESIEVE